MPATIYAEKTCLVSTAAAPIDFWAVAGWRRRLGAKFIIQRVQVLEWNVAEAAARALIDQGTVKRIEGGKNYEVEKLEAYALALGKPIERWLREILEIPDDVIRIDEPVDAPLDADSGEQSPADNTRRQRGKKAV